MGKNNGNIRELLEQCERNRFDRVYHGLHIDDDDDEQSKVSAACLTEFSSIPRSTEEIGDVAASIGAILPSAFQTKDAADTIGSWCRFASSLTLHEATATAVLSGARQICRRSRSESCRTIYLDVVWSPHFNRCPADRGPLWSSDTNCIVCVGSGRLEQSFGAAALVVAGPADDDDTGIIIGGLLVDEAVFSDVGRSRPVWSPWFIESLYCAWRSLNGNESFRSILKENNNKYHFKPNTYWTECITCRPVVFSQFRRSSLLFILFNWLYGKIRNEMERTTDLKQQFTSTIQSQQ